MLPLRAVSASVLRWPAHKVIIPGFIPALIHLLPFKRMPRALLKAASICRDICGVVIPVLRGWLQDPFSLEGGLRWKPPWGWIHLGRVMCHRQCIGCHGHSHVGGRSRGPLPQNGFWQVLGPFTAEDASAGMCNGRPKRVVHLWPRDAGIDGSHLAKCSIVSKPLISRKAACYLQYNAHVRKQVVSPWRVHVTDESTIGGERHSPIEWGVHAVQIPSAFPLISLVRGSFEQFRQQFWCIDKDSRSNPFH